MLEQGENVVLIKAVLCVLNLTLLISFCKLKGKGYKKVLPVVLRSYPSLQKSALKKLLKNQLLRFRTRRESSIKIWENKISREPFLEPVYWRSKMIKFISKTNKRLKPKAGLQKNSTKPLSRRKRFSWWRWWGSWFKKNYKKNKFLNRNKTLRAEVRSVVVDYFKRRKVREKNKKTKLKYRLRKNKRINRWIKWKFNNRDSIINDLIAKQPLEIFINNKKIYKRLKNWRQIISKRKAAKNLKAWKKLRVAREKNIWKKKFMFTNWIKFFIFNYYRRIQYCNKKFHYKFNRFWLHYWFQTGGIKSLWLRYQKKKLHKKWIRKKKFALDASVKFYYKKLWSVRLSKKFSAVNIRFVIRKYPEFFLRLIFEKFRWYLNEKKIKKKIINLHFKGYWQEFFYFLSRESEDFYFTRALYRCLIMKKLRSNYYFTIINGRGEVIFNSSSGSFIKKINEKKRNRKIRARYKYFDDYIKSFIKKLKKRKIYFIKYFIRKTGLKKRFRYSIPYTLSNNRITLGYIKNLAVRRHSKRKKSAKKKRM